MAKKRAHGEGLIRKRPDGRWEARLRVPGQEPKSIYGKTQKEVREKLQALREDVRKGVPVASEKPTLGQFLDGWLEDTVKKQNRPRTHESYQSLVRLHIKPALGKRPLAKLSPQEVQAFMNDKQDAGLSPRTVQYLRAVLRRALGQAVKWGLAPRNVAALTDPPRIEREEVAVWTPDEARAFLKDIRGHRLEALYTVALAIGLRQGEALGLRWSDVDLDAGVVRVRVQLQFIDKKFRLVEPKTAQSRRTISLPPFAVTALREHRARQLQDRLLAGEGWQGETWGLVFMTKRGTPLDGKNVTHRFQDWLKRQNLPRMRFHDLRHACASLLLAQGVHPRVVMEILGHTQIGMTMNTYSHVIPALQQEAAGRMDALLTGTD